VYTRVKHVFITNHFCLFIYLLHNISDGKSKDTFCVYTCIYSYFYSYFYPNVFLYFIAECIDVSTHMFVYTCQHNRCVYSIAECTAVSTHLLIHTLVAQHICLLICLLHNISDGRCKNTFCLPCIYNIPRRNHTSITYAVFTYTNIPLRCGVCY